MEKRKQKEKECGEREKRTGPAAAKPKLTHWGQPELRQTTKWLVTGSIR